MDIEYFVNLRPVLLLQLEEVVAFGTGASTRMELGCLLRLDLETGETGVLSEK